MLLQAGFVSCTTLVDRRMFCQSTYIHLQNARCGDVQKHIHSLHTQTYINIGACIYIHTYMHRITARTLLYVHMGIVTQRCTCSKTSIIHSCSYNSAYTRMVSSSFASLPQSLCFLILFCTKISFMVVMLSPLPN